jgi:hypothetical protein
MGIIPGGDVKRLHRTTLYQAEAIRSTRLLLQTRRFVLEVPSLEPNWRNMVKLSCKLILSGLLTCMQLSGSPGYSQDPLQGRLEEKGNTLRITRPSTPVLKGSAAETCADLSAHSATGTAGVGTFDDTSFQLMDRSNTLKGALDLSHWNPWASTRQTGRTSLIQPNGFLLARRYQAPVMHGDVRDLVAVERAWRPSATTTDCNGRTMTVSVTLALCRPGNPQQAAAWDLLMQELKEDSEHGDVWRKWQEAIAEDVASQANVLSQLPGAGGIHVRITDAGADPGRRPARIDYVRTPGEALAHLVKIMNDRGRFRLPGGTGVPEAHIMIFISTYSPYVGPGENQGEEAMMPRWGFRRF